MAANNPRVTHQIKFILCAYAADTIDLTVNAKDHDGNDDVVFKRVFRRIDRRADFCGERVGGGTSAV